MSTDQELDEKIAASLALGPGEGLDQAGSFAAGIDDRIRARAGRRKRLIRLAALLGAGAGVFGVYALVMLFAPVVSPAWAYANTVPGQGAGGAILLVVFVIAVVAECLPES